jgi:uncharacterized repeat protein (TIGR01451 family)
MLLTTIFVENNGDTTLYNVTINDPELGIINYDLGSLAPGENRTIYEVYSVTGSDPDPFINHVNVTAEDELGRKVNDTDMWILNLLYPDINVTKTANTTIAHVGDTVEYNINVTNTGDTIFNITINDATLSYSDSYLNLSPGGSAIFPFNYTIQPSDPDPFINVVEGTGTNGTTTVKDNSTWNLDILNPSISVNKTATHPVVCSISCNGTYIIAVTNTGDTPLYNLTLFDDMFGSPPSIPSSLGPREVFSWQFDEVLTVDTLNNVTASGEDILGMNVRSEDSAFVDFINPGIKVIKTSNVTLIHPGDPVEYNYTVENTGDDPLQDVTLTDDQYGTIILYGGLGVGENFTETIVTNPTENTTNIATATGINSLNNTIQDTDNVTLGVINPKIEVNKTGPIRAPEGETVEYTITVKNTGDTTLTLVNITDTLLGELETELELEPGEEITLNPNYTIPSPSENVTNIVRVTGRDALGLDVSNSSTWEITVPHPDIEILKTGPSEACTGETITYNITVTNTGDTPLFNVRITDPMLGLDHTITGPFTGTTLLQVEYLIPPDTGSITNTAYVTGVCCVGIIVEDSDPAIVRIPQPVGGELINNPRLGILPISLLILSLITLKKFKEFNKNY